MKRKLMGSLGIMLVFSMLLTLVSCGSKQDAAGNGDGKKVLKVAMECGYAPYNWTQPTDSNGAVPISGSSDYAYGYDVMMAQKISSQKSSADISSRFSKAVSRAPFGSPLRIFK